MRQKIKRRLPVALGTAALVVAVLGPAPWAGAHGIGHALFAHKAGTAKKVASWTSLQGAKCSVGGAQGRIDLVPVSASGAAIDAGKRDLSPFLRCLYEDGSEQNDAASALRDVSTEARIDASIFPAGDDDWYASTRSSRRVEVIFDRPLAGSGWRVEVTRNGTAVPAASVPGNPFKLTFDSGAVSTAEWRIRVDRTGMGTYIFEFFS